MLAVPDGRDVGPAAAVQVRVVDRDTPLRLRVPVLVEQDGAVRLDPPQLRATERPLPRWFSRSVLDAWVRPPRLCPAHAHAHPPAQHRCLPSHPPRPPPPPLLPHPAPP